MMDVLLLIRFEVAIWKLSHINDLDVPKPNKENRWTKNHSEVLEPL